MTDSPNLIEYLFRDGFALAEGVLAPELLARLLSQLQADLVREAEWHVSKHQAHFTEGALLNALAYGGPYLELLDHDDFLRPFESVVGQDCIVYVLSSASVPPGASIYTNRIHVDSNRVCADQQIMLACMIFLSPATQNNGPLFLPGSFANETAPDEETFKRGALRVIAEPGDVLYFNPKTWHSGSPNPGKQWRHVLTAGFCRSWMKQRFDVPQLWNLEHWPLPKSKRVQQRLGLLQPVPVTYADYYAQALIKSTK